MTFPDGFSLKESMMELKALFLDLSAKIDHVETKLDTEVVKRAEWEMWKEIQRNTRRWAIGIMLTMTGLILTATTVILSLD